MSSVFLFVLSVLVASVSGWGRCYVANSYWSGPINGNCKGPVYGSCGDFQCSGWNWHNSCNATALYNGLYYSGYLYECPSSFEVYCAYKYRCDTKAEADSVNCVFNPSAPGCAQDTTYHCQNTGGPDPAGYSGAKSTAVIFRQINGGVAVKTAELAGTCQDWGWCPDGVDDCDISKDSLGRNPCRRSGAEFISGSRCYYQCPDGTGLACRPTSTEYVAGATWAARCPELPSVECQPPHSSASSSPSSSPSVSSSSFKPPEDWEDPAGEGENFNYTAILAAIHDTLHVANVQRDFIRRLDSAISFNVGSIANNTIGTVPAINGINSRLSSLQENGVKLENSYVAKIDSSKDFLREINDYLRNDSLYTRDTSYNPLLRDIKGALESSGDTSRFWMRDSAFARWWSDYSQDSAAQKGVIGKIWDNIKSDRDSVLSRNCTGFNECLAVYKKIDYCARAWGVSTVDCVDGGSPFDNMLNVEGSILSTLWDAVWGEDSTSVDTVSRLDTSVTFSPQKDTAEGWLSRAFGALFSPESTEALLQKVERMKDSVERAGNDSVKVQPDSLWLDSSQAAGYVQDMLLPPGTVAECWVCDADLGTFGGLAPDGLSIHVDFGNFGGFDFCAIIRAVVKIAAFVICMSLTLGSWMAAFGYNPKNDA